jgi:hypothetical protein
MEDNDYKFNQWLTFARTGGLSLECKGLHNTGFSLVALRFIANARRAIGMPGLVESAFSSGLGYGSADMLAEYFLTEKKYDPFPGQQGVPEKIRKDKVRGMIMGGHRNLPYPDWNKSIVHSADYAFWTVVKSHEPEIVSLMFTQLSGMWTAFETICADLWELAVNILPDKMASGPVGTWAEIKQLTGGDLCGKVGTVLREKYKFDGLKNIIQAYRASFTEHADDIFQILTDENVIALSRVRHLIMREDGRVDVEYEKHFVASNNLLPTAPRGHRIPMNGEIVANLISPIADRGLKLIRAVDSWVFRESDMQNGKQQTSQ